MVIYPCVVCVQHVAANRLPHRRGLELATCMVPLLIGFSAPHYVYLHLIIMAPFVFAAFLEAPSSDGSAFSSVAGCGKRLRFVAEYRAVMMVTTCIAILAVDFPSVFPRAHAKTEQYGFSLMDLGTGCIICSSGICSRAARGLGEGDGRPWLVARRAASLSPVLVLGIVRLLVLWGIDYHVPAEEYGTHWNFFHTIAVVSLLATASDLSARASGYAGCIALGLYQMALSNFGLAEFLLHAPRTTFFSANKEGILSCIGYLGIHWLSVFLGSILRTDPNAQVTLWRIRLTSPQVVC